MQASIASVFDMLKGNLSKTAEQVGEDLYGFTPTPDVRSIGQLIGHIADSPFGMCATAAGEKPPQSTFFTGPTTRLGILAFNNAHSYEHYGSLVTYMRLKGMVPPSSGGN